MKKTICAVTAAMLALTSVLCGCSSNGESSSQSGSTTPATVATDTTVKTTGEKIHINDSKMCIRDRFTLTLQSSTTTMCSAI